MSMFLLGDALIGAVVVDASEESGRRAFEFASARTVAAGEWKPFTSLGRLKSTSAELSVSDRVASSKETAWSSATA
jgi:hypothetical protein